MKFWLCIVQLTLLIGCSSKSDSESKPEQYLYFTSNFPSSIYWEIMVTFESKSGMFWCKDLSMGDGGLVQKVKYEHYLLKKSDDTLKVPLFWSKTNLCDWKRVAVSIRPQGRSIRISHIDLKDKYNLRDPSEVTKPLPDSLNFVCSYDSNEGELNCEGEHSEVNTYFLFDDTLKQINFRSDLRGF